MMLLFLGMILEHLIPSQRKLDKVDHVCMWTIRCCLIILFLTLPHALGATTTTTTSSSNLNDGTNPNDSVPNPDFFFACSGGKLEDIQKAISKHPDWINARTDNGEACLHLTGIYGHSKVTEFLLNHGADPNIRSTYSEGLRMHPLSWNIYGGHYDNIELLLDHGANVNLDFDSMNNVGPVTAMDVLLQLQVNEEGDERFTKLETLLRKHGGKTMAELKQEAATTEQEL